MKGIIRFGTALWSFFTGQWERVVAYCGYRMGWEIHIYPDTEREMVKRISLVYPKDNKNRKKTSVNNRV